MSVVRFSEYLLQMTDDRPETYHRAAARGSQTALAKQASAAARRCVSLLECIVRLPLAG
jgi:hypothetical protein